MPRHDRALGVHWAPGSKGKGRRGRRVMVTRRRAAGLDKPAFEAMVRRLSIAGRELYKSRPTVVTLRLAPGPGRKYLV
jgi:hypothetical protein